MTWVRLKDYPRYAVHPDGHVKNLESGCVIAGCRNREGYKYVTLCTDSGHIKHLVHCLIMACFVGDCPAGHSIDHVNKKRDDNRLSNLRYVTLAENSKHADHSNDPRGEAHAQSRLTNVDVIEIRRLGAFDCPRNDIAKRFKIPVAHVHNIINRKRWAHI